LKKFCTERLFENETLIARVDKPVILICQFINNFLVLFPKPVGETSFPNQEDAFPTV
jgi:hypothetical protein